MSNQVPTSKEAVVRLPVSRVPAYSRPATAAEAQVFLVSRKPAPDATQPAVEADYQIVRFSY